MRRLTEQILWSGLVVLATCLAVHQILVHAPGKARVADGASTAFVAWLGHVLTGDLGESAAVRLGAPVTELLSERFVTSTWVVVWGLVLALFMGIGLGWIWHRGMLARVSRPLRTVLYWLSVAPTFLLAYWLMLGINLGVASLVDNPMNRPSWFPLPIDRGIARYALASAVLAVGSGMLIETARAVQQELDRVAGSDFVLFAKAAGAPVARHAAPALVAPLATLAINRLTAIFGGLLIVELILQLPGFGMLTWTAALRRDLAVLMAVTMVWALLYALARVLSEAVAMAADPRRRGDAGEASS